MLISHQKKFIYAKTIKTAGSSVEEYFEPYCVPKEQRLRRSRGTLIESDDGIVGQRGPNAKRFRWHSHMSAFQIKKQIGDDIWNEYFKFCVIRNPFDKLVSAFHYFDYLSSRRRGWQRFKFKCKYGFMFDTPKDDVFLRFRRWVARTWWFNDRKAYMINDRVCVDHFIHFERLHLGVQEVCRELNIPFRPNHLEKRKSHIRPRQWPLRDYYDEKTIEIVAQRFRFELDYFGYDVPF